MRICFNKIVNSYIAIIVLTLLILIRDLGHITVPFIIFSFTVLIFGLLTDSNGRLLIISYLLPFCRALPYSELLIIVLFIDMVFSIKKNQSTFRVIFTYFINNSNRIIGLYKI